MTDRARAFEVVQPEPSPLWLCIDPGTEVSGAVVMDGQKLVAVYPEIANAELLGMVENFQRRFYSNLAIEMVASYGMPVGKEVFETVLWIGRFMQAFGFERCTKVYRAEVKSHLCRSQKANDANIRQAILDMYSASGGGATPQVGTKSKPGPLFGVSKHAWSALAVGLTVQKIESVA